MTIGGCGTPAADGPADDSSPASRAGESLFADPDEPTGGDDNEADEDSGGDGDAALAARELTPIEEALGTLSDPYELSAIYSQAYRSHAEYAQRCMIEEGFQGYVVETWTLPKPEEFAVLDGNTTAMREFGYGVAGSLKLQVDNLQLLDQQTEDLSLNAEYLSSLSESDTTALRMTLQRCTADAWEMYPLPDSYPAEIADDIVRVQADALASPEVLAGWDEWATCMSEAGFSYRTRDDAVADIQQRATAANAGLEEAYRAGRTPSTDQVSELDALIEPVAAHERLVVDHDADCADAVGIADVIRTAIERHETAWLEENGERVALVLAEQPSRWWEQ